MMYFDPDELSLLGVAAPRFLAMERSNNPSIKARELHERDTIPAPVGILPLDHFIYILIGVLVFLCGIIALWNTFKAAKSPKKYYQAMRSQAGAHVAAPYKSRYSLPPGRVNAKMRAEVRKLKEEPKYQGDGSLGPSLTAKLDLPIPVVVEKVEPEQSGIGSESLDIEAWGNLVKERESLKITIANLERLTQVQQQSGQLGSINPRLLAARQRHAEVQNSIGVTYEKFRERRAEWSTDEWQIIELIMQHSPR
jgi:hypothetical protein